MALRRHMQALWPVFAAFGLIVVGVMLGSRSSQQPTRPPETPESIEPTAPIPASPAEAKEREITEEDAGKPGDPDLCKQYQDINEKHFGNQLPVIPVLWEPRLKEIGAPKAKGFIQEGLWAVHGDKCFILLNTHISGRSGEIRRALCHEMIHEYLFTIGDTKTNHGPAFQTELRRLLAEGAFRAILASENEKGDLRAWLEREQRRLDVESVALKELGANLDGEQSEIGSEKEALDRETYELNQRIIRANDQQSGWPTDDQIEAVKAKALLHNQRVAVFRAS
jgi:hypothetical protein